MVTVWKEKRRHEHSSPGSKEDISQLNHIIGPMRRDDEIYMHNEGRLWSTWDHYPIYAGIQEDGHTKKNQKGRKKKWTGWKAKTEDQKLEFKKMVMKENEDIEDTLENIQRTIENAAGKVAHHTNAERDKNIDEYTREKLQQGVQQRSRGEYSRNKVRKAKEEHHVRCCFELGKKKTNRKPSVTEDREEWQKKL